MNPENRERLPEPWLRGTLTDVPAVGRAVVHALELAHEDLHRWAGRLTDDELNLRPCGIAPVAFHIRHISRSVDRLLTYAEGKQLSAGQITLLKTELELGAKNEEIFTELDEALQTGTNRVRALANAEMSEKREVGNKRRPTTLGGLLVHVAEHTQRHVGQAITTAKVVSAQATQT